MSEQDKSVEMMRAISGAILEDANSPSTNTFLQYTMSQCFKKVMRAVRVYATEDKEELNQFHRDVFGEFGRECFAQIINAAQKLEHAAIRG